MGKAARRSGRGVGDLPGIPLAGFVDALIEQDGGKITASAAFRGKPTIFFAAGFSRQAIRHAEDGVVGANEEKFAIAAALQART